MIFRFCQLRFSIRKLLKFIYYYFTFNHIFLRFLFPFYNLKEKLNCNYYRVRTIRFCLVDKWIETFIEHNEDYISRQLINHGSNTSRAISTKLFSDARY